MTDLEEQARLTAAKIDTGTVKPLAFSIGMQYSALTLVAADLDDKRRRIDLLHGIMTSAKQAIQNSPRDQEELQVCQGRCNDLRLLTVFAIESIGRPRYQWNGRRTKSCEMKSHDRSSR